MRKHEIYDSWAIVDSLSRADRILDFFFRFTSEGTATPALSDLKQVRRSIGTCQGVRFLTACPTVD